MIVTYSPIGTIRSPFYDIKNMPIQPSGASGIRGSIEIFSEFIEGMKDLQDFSHLILLYHFHKVKDYKLVVTPFLDSSDHGIFSTRAPKRPNPIGLSIVKLLEITGNAIQIENVDILNGTPILDIKPYVPEFDEQNSVRTGWLAQANGKVQKIKSDGRFEG